MQKHPFGTCILLAILTFCLAMPTLGHETPEFRRRATAETDLNAARFQANQAGIVYSSREGYYNLLAANWNTTIGSIRDSLVGAVSLDTVIVGKNLGKTLGTILGLSSRSNELEDARTAMNTAYSDWAAKLQIVANAETAFNEADKAWKATWPKCPGGCGPVASESEHLATGSTNRCGHTWYTCNMGDHHSTKCGSYS